MFVGPYITGTALQEASNYLDTTANNIANSNTTGFKTAQVSFQDLLYQSLVPPGGRTSANTTTPTGTQLGLGVATQSITGQFTQGTLTPTGNPLDVAINGNGLLQVTLPDGTIQYTRAGSLTLNANGQLETRDGLLVSPSIVVPPGATNVAIGADGTVTATTSTGPVTLGQLTLARFVNPQGLLRVGDTRFAESAASGPPTVGAPGTNGLGTLQSGTLEDSNVNLTSELVNLIVAQQTIAFNAQALIAQDQLLSDTTSLIS